MKTILGYKTFKNNDEFVKWQLDQRPKLFQVSPIVMGMDGNEKSKSAVGSQCVFDLQTNVGVFVTFEVMTESE